MLLEPLGEGGQASVWKASDALDDATRAVKLIALRLASGSEVERLRVEARLLARLRHPSLCRCYGVFEDLQHEVIGFAMDFVPGRTLGDFLEDPRFNKALRERAVLHVARALAYVHEAGAVHRDVKLANVIVDERFFAAPDEPSYVKLVDFGIAALDGVRQRLTATGHAVGTPAYMAPEQIDPSYWGVEKAGPQADVFAFGVLCWRVFIGGHPTRLPGGAGMGDYLMAYRKAAKEGAWPPRMPAKEAIRATKRCLALRPHDRFEDGRQLVARLEEALGMTEEPTIEQTGAHAVPRGAPASGVTRDALTRVEPGASHGVNGPPARTLELAPPAGTSEGDTEPAAPLSEPLHAPPQVSPTAGPQPARATTVRDAERQTQPRLRWPWRLALVGLAAVAACAFFLLRAAPTETWANDHHDDSGSGPELDRTSTATETPVTFARAAFCDVCATGQACNGDCNDALAPDRAFVLRLRQVTYSQEDAPNRVETLKGISVSVCVPDCVDLTSGTGGIPVTARQLGEGIRIVVSDGNRTLIDWRDAAKVDPIRREVLCKGLDYRLDGKSAERYRSQPRPSPFAGGTLRWIAFYLDPVDVPPARCAGHLHYLP